MQLLNRRRRRHAPDNRLLRFSRFSRTARCSLLPALAIVLLLAAVPAIPADETESEIEGGFKIATPPLGYPHYTGDPRAKRNRATLAYLRFDNEILDMHGFSAHVLTRLIQGEWGAFSVKYGGFYATGQELDAVHTEDPVTGKWTSDGDFDLTVYGVEFEMLLEIPVVDRRSPRGRQFRLIPFGRLDTGVQIFEQETADSTYSSVIVGGTGGMQGHFGSWESFIISPFVQVSALSAFSSDSVVGTNFLLWPSYGFDVIFRGFSLSGIVQPLMGPAGIYTVAIGFEF